jgi:ribosomal protein S26
MNRKERRNLKRHKLIKKSIYIYICDNCGKITGPYDKEFCNHYIMKQILC